MACFKWRDVYMQMKAIINSIALLILETYTFTLASGYPIDNINVVDNSHMIRGTMQLFMLYVKEYH